LIPPLSFSFRVSPLPFPPIFYGPLKPIVPGPSSPPPPPPSHPSPSLAPPDSVSPHSATPPPPPSPLPLPFNPAPFSVLPPHPPFTPLPNLPTPIPPLNLSLSHTPLPSQPSPPTLCPSPPQPRRKGRTSLSTFPIRPRTFRSPSRLGSSRPCAPVFWSIVPCSSGAGMFQSPVPTIGTLSANSPGLDFLVVERAPSPFFQVSFRSEFLLQPFYLRKPPRRPATRNQLECFFSPHFLPGPLPFMSSGVPEQCAFPRTQKFQWTCPFFHESSPVMLPSPIRISISSPPFFIFVLHVLNPLPGLLTALSRTKTLADRPSVSPKQAPCRRLKEDPSVPFPFSNKEDLDLQRRRGGLLWWG